jgi:hypothetical protein
MDAMAAVPVVSALVGPVVGLAAAKAAIGHFRSVSADNLPNAIINFYALA